MSYTLTEVANADLDGILRYGIKVWGQDSAIVYFRALIAEIDICAQNPEIGLKIPGFEPECRSWLAKDYVIFYRKRESDIEVFRVAHQKSDILKWLRKQKNLDPHQPTLTPAG